MHIERKKDLSIYYWLVALFTDVPYVNIRDGFPISDLVIPTVSVEGGTINLLPHEIGNKNRVFSRYWRIDVFGDTKSQRDDFTYRILENLQDTIPVYDYDEGFPPGVSPTQLGCLNVRNVRSNVIEILPEFTQKLYYRTSIALTAEYNKF